MKPIPTLIAMGIALALASPATADAHSTTVWVRNDTEDLTFEQVERVALSGSWTDVVTDKLLPRAKYATRAGRMVPVTFLGNIAGELTYRAELGDGRHAYATMRFHNPLVGGNSATCRVTDGAGEPLRGYYCGYRGSIGGYDNTIDYRIVRLPL